MYAAATARTLAILPVKTFGAAKQRLSAALGSRPRETLARAMLADVLDALSEVPELDEIAVVTAEPVAVAGVRVLRDTEQAGQSAAAAIGIRYGLSAGFERALLVPGDTPLLDSVEVSALLGAREPVVIVPDRHGEGTNALVLSPPDAIEPSFGPGSRARHEAAARQAGLEHRVEAVPTLLLDLDTPADLAELAAALGDREGRAPSTRGALRELDPAVTSL